LDESGGHDLLNVDPYFPVFVSCGVIISKRAYQQLEIDVKNLKNTFRPGKKEDSAPQKHFQQLCTRGTGYVSPERIHAYATDIEFKAKMEDVNELQLADLTACPIARYVMDLTRANPASDVLESKFYKKGGKRYGLKVFP
jgi:hypothetical protein